MAQQEEGRGGGGGGGGGGWPLGLQPLNVNVRSVSGGSVSFNTLLSVSPSSSLDSSDLDTQSTGSFFHERSMTLGNLMGVSSIVELSRRSLTNRRALSETLSFANDKTSPPKPKPWCLNFCLCPRNDTDVDIATDNTVPLGHFLEVERRAAHEHRRGQPSPLVYGPDELAMAQPFGEVSNSLFVDGRVAAPSRSGSETEGKREGRGLRTPCF